MLWSISFGCQQNENLSWLGHIILILPTNIRCIGIKMEREENQGAAVLVEERTMAQGGG